jgi:hypothetical protein
VAWETRSNDFNPLGFFLCGYMKLKVYHSGEPVAKQQLAEATDEAAVGIRRELRCLQWQH